MSSHIPSNVLSTSPPTDHSIRDLHTRRRKTMPTFAPLDLEPLQNDFRQRANAQIVRGSQNLPPEQLGQITPAASTAIPIPQSTHNRPATPLSGRPSHLSTFDSAFSEDLRLRRYPSSSTSQSSSDQSISPKKPEVQQPRSTPSADVALPRRQPIASAMVGHRPSPLSPGAPSIPRPPEQGRGSRPVNQNLRVPGLGKFHPANFQNRDTLLPRTSHSGTSSRTNPQHRPGSQAQQRLQQYQRDVVENLKRLKLSPQSPRLGPQGSPGGPITPLALESQGDYFSGASGQALSSAANARELVDQLVQKENERRAYHPTGSGNYSPVLSPAISPAISPAGGPG